MNAIKSISRSQAAKMYAAVPPATLKPTAWSLASQMAIALYVLHDIDVCAHPREQFDSKPDPSLILDELFGDTNPT